MGRAGRLRWAAVGAVVTVGLAAAAPAEAASSVVARWTMADRGSRMVDSSGRGHTGTLHGVAVRQPGQSGYGYGFGSGLSYVGVPSSGDFNPGTKNLSMTMSVKFSTRPSSAVGDYDLMRKGLASTAGGSYKMEILANGKGYCDFHGSTTTASISGGPNLADNRWHRITCARVAGAVVLTVDGRSYRRTANVGSVSNTSSLYIGAKDGGGQDQYTGLMDTVSIAKG